MGLLSMFRRDAPQAAPPPAIVRAMAGDAAVFGGMSDPRLLDFIRHGEGGLTDAGISISPAAALRNTTVLRCVSLISSSIGMLPLHLQQKRTKERASDHPLFRVLHRRPNAWQTAFEFRVQMQQAALGASGPTGDAFARIIRTGSRVTQLVPLPSDRMTVHQRPDWALEYHFLRPDGRKVVFQQADVFHLRYGMTRDGITGLSLVRQAAEAIALAIQSEKASARLFRQGMLAGGMLKHPGQLSQEAYARLLHNVEEREGAENAYKTLILEEGMEYSVQANTGRESQAIEQRKHQIEEIARPFGVPRPLLGVDDTSWGSGIDVLGQFFVRYALNPWFEAWQQAIERSLLTPAEADLLEAKFNAGALLRGSMKDQAEFFSKALGSGGHQPWMHQDEVRDLMDMPPRDDLPAAMGTKGEGDDPAQDPAD